jgi:hypothetical protein
VVSRWWVALRMRARSVSAAIVQVVGGVAAILTSGLQRVRPKPSDTHAPCPSQRSVQHLQIQIVYVGLIRRPSPRKSTID